MLRESGVLNPIRSGLQEAGDWEETVAKYVGAVRGRGACSGVPGRLFMYIFPAANYPAPCGLLLLHGWDVVVLYKPCSPAVTAVGGKIIEEIRGSSGRMSDLYSPILSGGAVHCNDSPALIHIHKYCPRCYILYRTAGKIMK